MLRKLLPATILIGVFGLFGCGSELSETLSDEEAAWQTESLSVAPAAVGAPSLTATRSGDFYELTVMAGVGMSNPLVTIFRECGAYDQQIASKRAEGEPGYFQVRFVLSVSSVVTGDYYATVEGLPSPSNTVYLEGPVPPPAKMSVTISGPGKGNNSGTYTWCANVTGTGLRLPYTYDWRYSYDGRSYVNSFGRTQCVTAQLPLDRDLYLRVRAADSAGHAAVDYHFTMNVDANP